MFAFVFSFGRKQHEPSAVSDICDVCESLSSPPCPGGSVVGDSVGADELPPFKADPGDEPPKGVREATADTYPAPALPCPL
jgi:hypothetical protein